MLESPLSRAYTEFGRHPLRWLLLGALGSLPIALEFAGRIVLSNHMADWLFLVLAHLILIFASLVAAEIVRQTLSDLRSSPASLQGIPAMKILSVGLLGRLTNVAISYGLVLAIGAWGARLAMLLVCLPLAIPFIFVIPAIVDRNVGVAEAIRESVASVRWRYLPTLWEFTKLFGGIYIVVGCLGMPLMPRPGSLWSQYFHPAQNYPWAYWSLCLATLMFGIPLYHILTAVLYEATREVASTDDEGDSAIAKPPVQNLADA